MTVKVGGTKKRQTRDSVLYDLLPDGPKDFPGKFLDTKEIVKLDLPSKPISVMVQPGDRYVVQSDFGFRHTVRNRTEGNFIFYAYLRGHQSVSIPKEMIDVFRAVKGYENYLRNLRHALLQAYERKSGHKTMAEHKTQEVLNTMGCLGWIEPRVK